MNGWSSVWQQLWQFIHKWIKLGQESSGGYWSEINQSIPAQPHLAVTFSESRKSLSFHFFLCEKERTASQKSPEGSRWAKLPGSSQTVQQPLTSVHGYLTTVPRVLPTDANEAVLFWSGYFSLTNSEKETATHSSVLAWRIPGTGELGGLPSLGSHRVGHNWSNLAAAAAAEHSQN